MDMSINVKIIAPELCEALARLAEALGGKAAAAVASPTPVPQAVPAPAVPAPVATAAPAPAPVAAPAPVPPVPVAAAPAYTMDALCRAAAELSQAGKQPELLALLQQFGVQGMSQLKGEQYGAFATALRQMGGRI